MYKLCNNKGKNTQDWKFQSIKTLVFNIFIKSLRREPSRKTCFLACINNHQQKTSKGVLIKRCSENKQQIYRRAPMPNAISIKL